MWRQTMKVGSARKSISMADEVVAVIGYDSFIARAKAPFIPGDKVTRNLDCVQKRSRLIMAGASVHHPGELPLSKLAGPELT